MPATAENATRLTTAARWGLASLCLSMIMPSLDTSIANVGLPTLAAAFDASFAAVQWVVLAYLLAITTLIVSVGRLGDLFGRRRLLLAGIALFTLASLVCGTSPSLGWLIAARAAQGLGAAVMMALTLAMTGETVPKARTGSAMGLLGTMSAIGTSVGPSLGGFLISLSGWPVIFLINVPLGVLNLWLAWRYLPADPASGKTAARFDIPGTVLLALTLAAYALSMTAGNGRWSAHNFLLLLAAAVGAGLFIFSQSRTASPLVRLAMLRERGLGASLTASLLVAAVMMATLVVGPFYLSQALALDTVMVGLVMSVGPVLSALGGVIAGRIVDRFGAGGIVRAGLVEMATGAAALAVLPPLFGACGYIAAIALLTPGYQLFQAANTTQVMADIAGDRRGVVSGLLSLSRNLGLVTGVSVMGALFAFGTRLHDVTAGLQLTFAVATALIVLAIALVTIARRAE